MARIFNAVDEEVAHYRAVSSLAIAGLLAGLLSPLALLAPGFWVASLAAVVLSLAALWRIAARAPDLIGRKAALTGLLLGTAFLVAAPVEDVVYRHFLHREARGFARVWIDAVGRREVYQAHSLMIDPRRRLSPDQPLAEFYLHNEAYRKMLNVFVNDPVVRTLFALGPEAEIRYYETAGEGRQEAGDFVQDTYAVSYFDASRQKQTFFITLLMNRVVDRSTGRPGWTLARIDGGVRPSGW